MTDFFDHWSATLFYATFRVTLCFTVAYVLLPTLQIRSARIHRIAWATVVFQGCMLGTLTIAVAMPSAQPEYKNSSVDNLEPNVAGTKQAISTQRQNIQEMEVNRPVNDVARPVLVSIWGIGIVFVVSRSIWRYTTFVATVSLGEKPNSEWLSEWENVLLDFPNVGPVQLRITEGTGPAVCFVPWGYMVLVPESMWLQMTSNERLSILRHELSHVQRMDLWKTTALRAAAVLQWFNPLVWNAVQRFEEASEWACDDHVRALSASEYDYAKTLLAVVDYVSTTPSFMPSMSGGNLSNRINRLVSEIKEDSIVKKCILTLGLAFVSLTVVRVQQVSADEGKKAEAQSNANLAQESLSAPVLARPVNEMSLSITRHVIDLEVDSPRLVRFDVPIDAIRSRDASVLKAVRKGSKTIKLTASKQGSAEVEVKTTNNGTIVLEVSTVRGIRQVTLQCFVCSFENDGKLDGRLASVLAKRTSEKISPMTLLTDPEYKELSKQLSQIESTKVFAEPVLTTVSGRPAGFSTISGNTTSVQTGAITPSRDTPGVRVELTPNVTETDSIRFAPRVFVAQDGKNPIRKRIDHGVIEMKSGQTAVFTATAETISTSKSRLLLVAVTPRLTRGVSNGIPKLGRLGHGKTLPVADVRLEGTLYGSEPDVSSRLQTREGGEFDEQAVQDDVRQLLSSSSCDDIRVYCAESPHGLIVTFEGR